jgi:hypothetical protein
VSKNHSLNIIFISTATAVWQHYVSSYLTMHYKVLKPVETVTSALPEKKGG